MPPATTNDDNDNDDDNDDSIAISTALRKTKERYGASKNTLLEKWWICSDGRGICAPLSAASVVPCQSVVMYLLNAAPRFDFGLTIPIIRGSVLHFPHAPHVPSCHLNQLLHAKYGTIKL
jgi:hypothetical protein